MPASYPIPVAREERDGRAVESPIRNGSLDGPHPTGPALRPRTHPFSWRERLQSYLFNRWLKPFLPPARIEFVRIGGRRFKRVRMSGSAAAARMERRLTEFDDSPYVTSLVLRDGRDIWVEYVTGEIPRRADAETARLIADFFAHLYARSPRRIPTDDTPYHRRLLRDIRFLHLAGLLDEAQYRALLARAERDKPGEAWIGYDYADAVLKNFVILPDRSRVCAIDIEGLKDDRLIGMGLAKCCSRGGPAFRAALLEGVVRAGVPDFLPYFGYVELCARAGWMRNDLIKKPWRPIDPAALLAA